MCLCLRTILFGTTYSKNFHLEMPNQRLTNQNLYKVNVMLEIEICQEKISRRIEIPKSKVNQITQRIQSNKKPMCTHEKRRINKTRFCSKKCIDKQED